jgi:5-methylcytosine-specific restriction endonuclease McrA
MTQLPGCLILNSDFQPLSYMPLSVWPWEVTMHSLFRDRIVPVEFYEDIVVRSPSTQHRLPSVAALKQYAPGKKFAPFTRYNVMLRDEFHCQYCSQKFEPRDLTFDHVHPRALGGKSSWTNVVAACRECNAAKGNRTLMKPVRKPIRPDPRQLYELGRKFPPRHLHEQWVDYTYWDVPLEEA